VAHGVVGVAAVVGGDPAELRRRRLVLQVVEEASGRVVEVGHLRRAVAAVEEGVEPRERRVLGDVLVGRRRASGVGHSDAGRVAGRTTGVGVPPGVIAKVLEVPLPAHVGGVELVEQGGHVRRVDAAIAANRAVGASRRGPLSVVRVGWLTDDRADGVLVLRAVGLAVWVRPLAADQRRVVVQAEMAGSEVVLQEDALLRQRLPQIGVVVQARECGVVGLVLQDDQPYVLDP
jgi:hypothetical protein